MFSSHHTQTVLVVAAHPDDEVLGCGGTLARHAQCGDRVHALILAEGITSRQSNRDAQAASDELHALRACSLRAAQILGFGDVRHASLPDNRMDTLALLDVVKIIEEAVDALRPSIVYTHFAHDLNLDHRVTAQAVMTACRPLPGHPVRRILQFETPSSTEWQAPTEPAFQPNCFVDIAEQLKQKAGALEAYAGEMRPFPHPRSIEAVLNLAAWRGASAGFSAAEAFQIARQCI